MSYPSNNEEAWGKAMQEGFSASWPICMGYIATGLQPLEIALMSLVVYTGSSQFMAAAILGAGAGFFPIVMTTFSVNLCHLLMSSSLSLHLRHLRRDRRKLCLELKPLCSWPLAGR